MAVHLSPLQLPQVPASKAGKPTEPLPEPEEVVLYMGIIDILQVEKHYNT